MSKKFEKWAYGLVGGIIGGGATAGSSWLGMAGAKAAGLDVPMLNFKSLGVIFLSGAVTNALMYLKQSPLPPIDGDTAFLAKPADVPVKPVNPT